MVKKKQKSSKTSTVQLGGIDRQLLIPVLVMLGLGIVMVYSASSISAMTKLNDMNFYLKRHIVSLSIGFIALIIAMNINYKFLGKLAYPGLVVTFVILVLVLIPGLGKSAGGATRWLSIAGFTFQPSELAKFSIILFLAFSLSRKCLDEERIKSFSSGFLFHMMLCGIVMLPILKQPDFGTTVIIGIILMLMMFVAGVRLRYLLLVLLTAIPSAYYGIIQSPYRLKRILAFLDPERYKLDIGYHIIESLISIGSGGVTGVGLGNSRQKLFFLPEAHTDFIGSILGEELGFIGIIIVAFMIGWLLWRGIKIGLNSEDLFASLLAFGITACLCLQAIINMFVIMGLLPTKGLTLPFISFGGTSLIISLFMVGVLLNISKNSNKFGGSSSA